MGDVRIFNALPIGPFDGGQLYNSLIEKRLGSKSNKFKNVSQLVSDKGYTQNPMQYNGIRKRQQILPGTYPSPGSDGYHSLSLQTA